MRKTILGSIAALAAGVTAYGQGPVPAPTPIGPGGMASMEAMPGPRTGGPGMGGPGMMPGGAMGGPGMPGGGMPGGGMGGPGGYADPNSVFPGGGAPGYPNGTHGQPSWQPPFNGAEPGGVNGRLAARAWLSMDYILGFAKSQPSPYPLVVTSAPLAGGILGNTSTAVLHSQSDLGYNLFNGVRINGGFWRDDARRYGYYASGFFTEYQSNRFETASDATGQPLLGRPFQNAVTGSPDVLLVSFPTYASGSIKVESGTQIWGAEGGPIVNLFRSCPDEVCLWNVNLLAGFRYLEVHERLNIDQSSTLIGNSTTVFDGKLYGSGSQLSVSDRFDTYNRFYGGQLGLNTELRMNNWYVNATGKVALGVMNERIDVRGQSTITGPNSSNLSVIHSGLYANATNIGRYNEDRFAVVPEVGVQLGYNWRSWLTTSVGYNFLYVSRVARPTEQYSTTINPAVIATSPTYGQSNGVVTPNPLGTQDSFWFQGVTFSIALRY